MFKGSMKQIKYIFLQWKNEKLPNMDKSPQSPQTMSE